MVSEKDHSSADLDVLIAGGGPAGLAASIYLSRFRRRVLVLDSGGGRARRIPLTRNCPGFDGGISGPELLAKMRRQTLQFGTQIEHGRVHRLAHMDSGFEVHTSAGRIAVKRVLICTGMTDIMPDLPDADRAIADGSLRLCPICDGYEALGKRIAVIGTESLALSEACFLRTYTEDVTYLSWDEFSPTVRMQANADGIGTCDRIQRLNHTAPGVDVVTSRGKNVRFDAIYVAMGSSVNLGLVNGLALDRDPEGFLLVDDNQQTSIRGIFAAGDVVKGIKQLAVSFGQAAVAATEIHNDLRRSG